MKQDYYIENEEISLERLKSWEIDLVNLLKEAVKISAEIYAKQLDPVTGQGNFYPSELSSNDIEKLGETNSEILSAYTMVVKEGNDVKAIRYHEYFADETNRLIEILEKAQSIYRENEHIEYADYIKTLIEDFKKSEFIDSEIRWLNIKNDSRVGIKIGPIETYQDKVLGIKRAYQGNLRVTDDEAQSNLKDYIDVINSIIPASPFAIDVNTMPFNVRVDKVVAMGGWHAELIPRSSNYPSDSNYIKHGIKAIIYTNNIESKLPVIQEITKQIINTTMLDESEMKKAAIRAATFHEISETIAKLRYYSEYEKLKHMRDKIVELHANITGIKSGSIQVLKGIISIEEYQYILLNFLAVALRGWVLSKSDKSLSAYGQGYKIAINYFFENEALDLDSSGKLNVDFPKLYSAIDSLSTRVSTILIDGDLEDADKLFEEYSKEDELLQIKPELDKVVSIER